MSRIKKWGAAAGALSLIAVATAAYLYPNGGPGSVVATDDAGLSVSGVDGQGGTVGSVNGGAGGTASANSNSDERRNTYIVVFKEPALASYKGTLPGLPTPERVREENGTMRLDSDGDNSQEYVDYLQQRQEQMEARMSTMAGRDVEPRLTMQHALNGMVVDLSDAEAKSIRLMSDVRLVEAYREYQLDTDVGPTLIGAVPVWNGTNPGAPGPYKGEGVVAGIIDTGSTSAARRSRPSVRSMATPISIRWAPAISWAPARPAVPMPADATTS